MTRLLIDLLARPSGSTLSRQYPPGRWLVRLLLTALLLCAGIAGAQTVTVTPSGYVTVGAGSTLQLSANVSGTTNQTVTWSLSSQSTGNLGSISASGLYTAPSTPPANGVVVKATSQAFPSSSGSQTVYILPAGPTISSVSPNPLNAGTVTVTITGGTFQKSAWVDYTYNGTWIQTNAITQTASTLTASIYVASSETSISFTATNPGTAASNVVSVPVNGGPPQYQLNVVNGTPSGPHPAGQVVSISANAPPAGMQFLNWTGATVTNPTQANTTLTMPSNAVTVTANYYNPNQTYPLIVNSGSNSGQYLAGTVVPIQANAPPAGMLFSGWTGATVANSTMASTTITMPGAPTAVTANYIVAATVPFPVTTHPRLWVTQADLPRLQNWASSSVNNPVYTNFKQLVNQCVSYYNTLFFPGGVANTNWPDPGDINGYQPPETEEVAMVLAFDSLIDPSPTNRITYAKDARNLLMYVMNIAVQGPLAGAPFRDPQFPTFNRANNTNPDWSLIVDWIYNATDGNGNPILTAADKATIRQVFMLWEQECCLAYNEQGMSAYPQGVNNSLSLVNNGAGPMRMASNNYYIGKMRNMTMLALSIDPADDPVVDPTKAPAAYGNTLRSYILNGTGGWLYQVYSMMGDGAQVCADYGLPASDASRFGLSSGGLPPEGMLYGESFGFLGADLLALQTAGFNNVQLSGPQIKMIGAPVWDRYVTGFLSSLTPVSKVYPGYSWAGPMFQMDSYGDLLRLYITPDNMRPMGLLALLEQEQGQTTHTNSARWLATQVVQGTLAYNTSDPWTWGCSDAIINFLLLDPTAPAATDPRPNFPLNFFDPAAGRVLARTDWSPSATGFDYRASWESIYHQDCDAGQFEFFRNGEWLTKEMSNYDNNGEGLTSLYHNTLTLENWCPNGNPQVNAFEQWELTNGSQWFLGMSAGDPITVNSYGPGYNYASSNLTNLYNRPSSYPAGNNLTDVTQANRSILWLNGDTIVVYDRATTNHGNLFKRFNLCLALPPTLAGNVATETLSDGQQLFVQALLPLNASFSTIYGAGNLSPHAELDPMNYVLTDQDLTQPADTRFLHVLQGANAGAAMVPATYTQSASGSAFDGAVFGSNAVFFPVSATAAVTTTAFNVPSTVTCFAVAGLTPGASYGLVAVTNGGVKTVTLTVGGTGVSADSAGLLKVGI